MMNLICGLESFCCIRCETSYSYNPQSLHRGQAYNTGNGKYIIYRIIYENNWETNMNPLCAMQLAVVFVEAINFSNNA
jgi:hypothetical protein